MTENDDELTELRYQETMKAVDRWVRGQGKDGILPAEARGIAKAFLTHASLALVSTLPGCDESDSQRLMKHFLEAVKIFLEEKMDDFGN